MLARRSRVPAERLKDRRGFAKASSPFFVVRYGKNDLPRSRLAVTVGTKVDRRSAERHKLKRRIAGYITKKARRPAQDVVITVLPPAAKLPRHEFYKELSKVLDIRY